MIPLQKIKVYVPASREPKFFEDWVLLQHGELDRYYKTTLDEKSLYCFTEDELRALLFNAFEKGEENVDSNYDGRPVSMTGKDDYINSLFNQTDKKNNHEQDC